MGQPRQLVADLLALYRVSYTTLRREGLVQTRVQVDLPGATGSFVTPALDVGSFYGVDTEGRIAVDEPAVNTLQGTAQMFIRALGVPRNINRFRFRLITQKNVQMELVANRDGGLLDGWTLSGPDVLGFYEVAGPQPLEFGTSGILLDVTVSGFTEKRLEIPLIFDNSIYTGGKSFDHPSFIHLGQRIPATGRIAFRSDRGGLFDIYIVNFDGTQLRNLTNSLEDEIQMTWSPDGRKIAFSVDLNGNREIFVMDVDGIDRTNLTNHPAEDYRPVWSFGGQKIAFDSDRDGNREIYIMNTDGSAQTRLTADPGDDRWAAWSPDGSRMAFTSNRDGDFEIYVMNADGSGQTNLTNHPAGDYRPAWSPDGQTIAFYSLRDGNREVYVMDVDGANQRNLTRSAGDDWSPSWSPGGGHIAFISFRDGNGEIYTMREDGTRQTNVTNNPGDDRNPAWGP